jgi:hypothetical protein
MPSAKDKTIATLCLIDRPGEFYIPLTNNLGIYNSIGFKVGEVDFSRNSDATLWTPPTLETFAVNEPRFTSDGLLIERSATNVLWANKVKVTGAILVNDDDDLGYVATFESSDEYPLYYPHINPSTFYCKVKSLNSESRYFKIGTSVSIIDHNDFAVIDLADGSVIAAPLKSRVEVLDNGDGYYIVTYFVDESIVGNNWPHFSPTDALGGYNVAGASLHYRFFQGEESGLSSSYIPTIDNPKTRGADNASFPASLLGSGDWSIPCTFGDVTVQGNTFLRSAGSFAVQAFDSGKLSLFAGDPISSFQINRPLGEVRFILEKSGTDVTLITKTDSVTVSNLLPLTAPNIDIGGGASGQGINSTALNIQPFQRLRTQAEKDAYLNG